MVRIPPIANSVVPSVDSAALPVHEASTAISMYSCAILDASEGKVRIPIEGDEELEPALGRPYFGYVDVEVANRVTLELLLRRIPVLQSGQAGDVMALAGSYVGTSGSSEEWLAEAG